MQAQAVLVTVPTNSTTATVLPEIYGETVTVSGAAELPEPNADTTVTWWLSDADGALDSLNNLLEITISGEGTGTDFMNYTIHVTACSYCQEGQTIEGNMGSGVFSETLVLDFSWGDGIDQLIISFSTGWWGQSAPEFSGNVYLDAEYYLSDSGSGSGTASVPAPLALMALGLAAISYTRKRKA